MQYITTKRYTVNIIKRCELLRVLNSNLSKFTRKYDFLGRMLQSLQLLCDISKHFCNHFLKGSVYKMDASTYYGVTVSRAFCSGGGVFL